MQRISVPTIEDLLSQINGGKVWIGKEIHTASETVDYYAIASALTEVAPGLIRAIEYRIFIGRCGIFTSTPVRDDLENYLSQMLESLKRQIKENSTTLNILNGVVQTLNF